MLVTIEKIDGRGAQTKKQVTPKIWRVRVDGRHEGTLGWAPNSRVNMHSSRWSPMELKEIERQIAELIERPVVALQPAEVPDEYVRQAKDEDEHFDDFE